MPWSVGGVSLAGDEEPIGQPDGVRYDGGEQRWNEFDPVGSNTTILTYLGQKSQRRTLEALVGEQTRGALKVVWDAQVPCSLITPYDTTTVQMVKFVCYKSQDCPDLWVAIMELVQR